ncbi:alpha/beta fold hydrolase [Chitinophaga sp. Cy-1792]|uniref:alpha/beta fold hydrolase n=1 Tax=Chitinophaga sp. Cy-1792 TaxID=2608339 RepID=UPI001424607F|nr:alpha/beta fold hydrolase [Chitinophaga sp. Cy-1792]
MNSQIHGTCEGDGNQLLICLHGFGESAVSFRPLVAELGNDFKIIGLDMPLHGQTVWNENRAFEKTDLSAILEMVLQQYGFQRFSLLGYSMGGRLALCAVEKLAGRLDNLIMVAGDGLRNNPWHLFVTQTTIGNKIFKYNVYHPGFFFSLVKISRKLNLLNESIYKFVMGRMDQPAKRIQVYEIWTILRKMMPDKKLCKQLLARYNVNTLLIFGKYDRVIPPELGTRFIDGTFPCKMLILDKGHGLVSTQLGLVIKSNL